MTLSGRTSKVSPLIIILGNNKVRHSITLLVASSNRFIGCKSIGNRINVSVTGSTGPWTRRVRHGPMACTVHTELPKQIVGGKMANVDIFYEEYSKEVGAFDELVTRLRNSFSVEDGTNKQQLIVEIESKYKR